MADTGHVDAIESLASEAYPLTLLADGTGILLDVSGMQVLSLNASAAFIVDAIRQGERSIDGLADRLAATFDVTEDAARSDVVGLLSRVRSLIGSQGARRESAPRVPGDEAPPRAS